MPSEAFSPAQPPGDDDGHGHFAGGAVCHDRRNLAGRSDDHRQVDAAGHRREIRIGRPVEYLGQLRVYGDDLAPETGLRRDQVLHEKMSEFARRRRGADQRDAARREERLVPSDLFGRNLARGDLVQTSHASSSPQLSCPSTRSTSAPH